MKPHNKLSSDPANIKSLIICIMSLLLALGAILYIAWAHIQAGRYMQPGVLVVMPLVNDPLHQFRPEDFSPTGGTHFEFIPYMELERLSQPMMESETQTAFAQVTETGPDYLDMVFMSFIHGGPWLDEDSIILSSALAWALFGQIDGIGLPIRIDDRLYTVVGVVKDPATSTAQVEGFAWTLREGYTNMSAPANILYLRPNPYNRLGAHLDAMSLLESLNRRPAEYTITDINVYLSSIALRGHILLALTGLFIMAVLLCHTVRLPHPWERAVAIVIGAAVIIFFARHLEIDLWVPAFAGEGWDGYRQLLFNSGLLAPRVYLPGHLTALYDWNISANIAFGVGIVGLFSATTHALTV